MGPETILKELEELARHSGVGIRYEKGDFDGGYCILRDERLIVVNKRLAHAQRASVVAHALADIGVDDVYLKPAVREFIEEALSRTSSL